MTTANDLPVNQQALPPKPLPWGPPPEAVPAAPVKPPREYSLKERLLVPAALLVAILFDRLVYATLWWDESHLPFFAGIFWLLYLVIFYAVYWNKLAKNKTLWLVGGFCAALCIWNFIFDYDSPYGTLTYLVIPAVLMAHAQFLAGNYKLKEVGKLAIAYLLGWFYKPFSGIPMLFGAVSAMTTGGKKETTRKVMIGILITLPLLLVIVPLLCGADMVFGYYLEQALGEFEISSFVSHIVVIGIALVLFYSFLWNVGFCAEKKDAAAKKEVQIDLMISCIVLGTVTLLYLLFCTVQFTYLFARAGLPGEMTYSEYAREGFAQMIVICGINLLLFGVFLNYGRKHKIVSVLLAALLGLTTVMLVSSFMRLRLYIDTYGLTWLRLLSAWFIVYLAAVLILSGVRMVKANLPLIAACAFLLLGWYAVLGYANPDALILNYNLRANTDTSAWVEENTYYVTSLSDNGILALLDADLEREALASIMNSPYKTHNGYSASSYRLRQRAEELTLSDAPRVE